MTHERIREQAEPEAVPRALEPAPAPPAHDAVLALQRSAGNAAVGRLLARAPGPRTTYPWIGEIHGTWSAALRKDADKKPDDPHQNTLADLPRGTQVTVVNKKGGWLAIQAQVDGATVDGYVSQELVKFVKASAFELPEIEVKVDVPSVAEAFVELKRAETQKAAGSFEPTQEEQDRLDLCVSVLRATKKYTVDTSTYRVSFDRAAGVKTQVTTIEDFILFVEEVEHTFPSAKPAEVAAEVRQMWFSDPNWELLVASQGIRSGGKLVDIETEAPIATSFDMKQMAPAKGSLQLDTAMGKVDIGHVMSGIDARLSGMPAAYPEDFLEEREDTVGGDRDTYANEAKYDALKAASGGDVRDFTTWSGDLGQAYAEYLVDRHLLGNAGATLSHWVTQKAPREEILGDIHGYIAVEVYKSVPPTESPTGRDVKISNILRDMYLVAKPAGSTYGDFFGKVSGKSPTEYRQFISDRTVAFARTWYAKRAYEEKGTDAWTPSGLLEEKGTEFDTTHAVNTATADKKDTVGGLVDDLLGELASPVR
jgi:hypothetical protein